MNNIFFSDRLGSDEYRGITPAVPSVPNVTPAQNMLFEHEDLQHELRRMKKKLKKARKKGKSGKKYKKQIKLLAERIGNIEMFLQAVANRRPANKGVGDIFIESLPNVISAATPILLNRFFPAPIQKNLHLTTKQGGGKK